MNGNEVYYAYLVFLGAGGTYYYLERSVEDLFGFQWFLSLEVLVSERFL
jgi:hypothetical protein